MLFWFLAWALIATFFLAGCTASSSLDLASISPAQHCLAQGGKPTLERGPDGEIGVCMFAGNRQCEERALLFGECPRGGVPVSAYATTSERHCAIRGGRMTIPGCALSPSGHYEGRNVVLLLQAGRTAMLRRGERSSPGRWQSSGNVVTVSTDEERLVFDYAGDRLIPREWDRRSWGAQGPGNLVRQK
jgi:hypothetical protein